MPHNPSEASIEAEIKTKGLTGPRLTPEHIDGMIAHEQYWHVPNTTLTICVLTLRNGFNVVGHSAAATARNFDRAIGKNLSRAKAREKIWQLEGYLLKQTLWLKEHSFDQPAW